MPNENLGSAQLYFLYVNAVYASDDMTASECAVALAIAKHADGWKNSYPKVSTLARETKLDRTTVMHATTSLVDKKWLIQTHSGRGGYSKWANSYDLNIPAGAAAVSKSHDAQTKSDGATLQSRIDPVSKSDGATTSSPSSTPRSSPVSSSEENRRRNEKNPRNPWRDTSYWLGHNKKYPDGYFIRVEGNSEPRGDHVRVDLTAKQVQKLFDGQLYPYEHILGVVKQYAWDQNPGVEWLNVSV
jgi:Helix-turn-helix domain